MALYDNAGRIPRQAASGSLLALFVFALLSAGCRFAVRLHYQRRLFWDDALLALAILFLCTCLGLWFSFVDDMYLAQSLLLGEMTPDMDLTTVIPKTLRLHKLSDVALVLTWTSLNVLKLSFLLFFRTLTSRANKLRMYWWAVTGFTLLTWAGGVPLEIVACPYFDERALTCASGSKLPKTISIAAALVAVNIASDLLIISIPVMILHKVSVPLRTKVFLGMSLCLSVMTIGTTIVRVGGLKVPGVESVDVVWQVYWQYVEVCIGIMIVSATAFRTFFVQRAARNSARRSTPKSNFGKRFHEKFLKSRNENTTEFGHGLPGYIPGGTLTGVRTFINANGKTSNLDTMTSSISRESEDKKSLQAPDEVYNRV